MLVEFRRALNLNTPPPLDRAKTDPKPIPGSADTHNGKVTAMITQNGDGLEASAGGKRATIPVTMHPLGLGLHIDVKA